MTLIARFDGMDVDRKLVSGSFDLQMTRMMRLKLKTIEFTKTSREGLRSGDQREFGGIYTTFSKNPVEIVLNRILPCTVYSRETMQFRIFFGIVRRAEMFRIGSGSDISSQKALK